MDYIGSKEKLNEWMFSKINRSLYKNKNDIIFLDACAGSGSVSRFAANNGFKVISNDLMIFSKHIVNGSIGISKSKLKEAESYIEELNNLKGKNGFFFHNYSETSTKLYFSDENAKKLDAIREYIENVKDEKIKDYLLYCSLEAMSRVSNTAGVQAAFLKKLKSRALNNLEIRCEKIWAGKVKSYSYDILSLLNNEKFRKSFNEDILYIDPPYNERQYAPNYHLYETFVKYDNPTIKGKTGLRENWTQESKSLFCSKSTCLKFLLDILEMTTAKYTFISYNSDGLLNRDEIEENLLKSFNIDLSVHILPQKRFKSDNNPNKNYNNSFLKEYLFEVRKK